VVIAIISFYDLFSNQHFEETMEQKEGIERADHRLHCWIKHALRDRAKDSIPLSRCGGWGKSAMHLPQIHARHLFAACFSIPASHHRMRAFPSAVSLRQNQKNRRATITPRGIPGIEWLSAHAR
jgi:hypothetical protein